MGIVVHEWCYELKYRNKIVFVVGHFFEGVYYLFEVVLIEAIEIAERRARGSILFGAAFTLGFGLVECEVECNEGRKCPIQERSTKIMRLAESPHVIFRGMEQVEAASPAQRVFELLEVALLAIISHRFIRGGAAAVEAGQMTIELTWLTSPYVIKRVYLGPVFGPFPGTLRKDIALQKGADLHPRAQGDSKNAMAKIFDFFHGFCHGPVTSLQLCAAEGDFTTLAGARSRKKGLLMAEKENHELTRMATNKKCGELNG